MTLLERIDFLRKLAEAEQNGKTIEYHYQGGWDKIAAGVRNDAGGIIVRPEDWRIKPEPVARPWSKPEDVPGPVCWIRGDGIEGQMVIGLAWSGDGLTAGNNRYSFREIANRRLEYSTDRKQWHPCTVTDPA